MEIEILSPNQKIYKGEAKAITFPGKKGQFQVLDGHAPLFALLKKGEIIIQEKKKIPIFKGMVEILNDKVIALVKEELKKE